MKECLPPRATEDAVWAGCGVAQAFFQDGVRIHQYRTKRLLQILLLAGISEVEPVEGIHNRGVLPWMSRCYIRAVSFNPLVHPTKLINLHQLTDKFLQASALVW